MRRTALRLPACLLLALAACVNPVAPGRHGAVAYAPSTQDWRLRWQAANPQRARTRVLADCPASDCRVVLEFGPGQCGTLSLGQPGLGVGVGATAAEAEAEALADCRLSGRHCRVAAAECNP